ncbi:MAG: hypothetical protein OXF02_00010 [Simkaniaceae bacterium]|nr:hypothetical protein [Simkaniaceae bacterium]
MGERAYPSPILSDDFLITPVKQPNPIDTNGHDGEYAYSTIEGRERSEPTLEPPLQATCDNVDVPEDTTRDREIRALTSTLRLLPLYG